MKKILSLTLILAMALSTVTVSYAADLSANLVAHWSFDEIVDSDGIQTVEDLTGNGNTLTINDTNYNVVTGFTGSAIDFLTNDNEGGVDKGAYAAAKHMTMLPSILSPQLNGKEGITVSMWMKRELIGSSAGNAVFCLSPVGAALKLSAQRYGFVTETRSMSTATAQTISVGRFYPLGQTTDFYPQVSNTNGPTSHEWVHVTAVNDYINKQSLVYLDGELVPGGNVTMNWDGGVSNFAADDSKGYVGVGSSHMIIDDVKVYDKALTAEEIKESIPAVIEYDFNEITDNAVKNKTGRAVDMTTTGTMTAVKGVASDTVKFSTKATMPSRTFYNSMLKSKAVSIAAWVKLEDGVLTTNNGGQSLFQEAIGGFNMALSPNGTVRVGARSQNGDAYTGVYSNGAVFTAGDTSWHHIAGIVDYTNGILKLYVDGALNNTADGSGFQAAFYNMASSANPDYIDYGNTANVILDGLKLFRRSLTEAEIVKMASELPFADTSFAATANSVTATCNIANLSGSAIAEGGASLILAAYDKTTNLLTYVEKTDLPALSNGQRLPGQSVTISGIDAPENYNYKLLVWGSFAELISYQDEIEYTIN